MAASLTPTTVVEMYPFQIEEKSILILKQDLVKKLQSLKNSLTDVDFDENVFKI
jgi:hypothetical protein